MAKTEGDQSIPSALLDAYRATLGEQRPDKTVEKRYPYRLPHMQAGGADVKPAQAANRTRFLLAISHFASVSWAERQRWYAARPPWSSYLWYYNYFIMSDLMGNANLTEGGAGVIKSIQVKKESVPTTGTKSFTITSVDPNKTVVMVYGNSYISDKIQRGNNTVNNNSTVNCALSPNVELAIAEVKLQGFVGHEEMAGGDGEGDWAAPYVSALTVSQLTVGLQDVAAGVTCKFSYEVIEHKAQTIYPVLVSIAATAVVIDWSKVPSVAADVSIIVIEYI